MHHPGRAYMDRCMTTALCFELGFLPVACHVPRLGPVSSSAAQSSATHHCQALMTALSETERDSSTRLGETHHRSLIISSHLNSLLRFLGACLQPPPASSGPRNHSIIVKGTNEHGINFISSSSRPWTYPRAFLLDPSRAFHPTSFILLSMYIRVKTWSVVGWSAMGQRHFQFGGRANALFLFFVEHAKLIDQLQNDKTRR